MMALSETELYSSHTDPLFNFGYKDLYSMVSTGAGANWGNDHHFESSFQDEEDKVMLFDHLRYQNLNAINNIWETSSPSIPLMQKIRDEQCDESCQLSMIEGAKSNRRKRRRTVRSSKNQEEIENQRRTHIAVERNRRKQMNDYLSILRSLMPSSYVPRGDQASIIGGAINFVKELEQLLQTMEGRHKKTNQEKDHQRSNSSSPSPLAQFLTFPQCSTRATQYKNSGNDSKGQNECAVSDIEVTIADSHANIKILAKKIPKQLLRMVVGFQNLLLSIFHLNVTTVDQMVLYSVSVKIEEGCQLNTVDEIATAVNQMMHTIQEEPVFS